MSRFGLERLWIAATAPELACAPRQPRAGESGGPWQLLVEGREGWLATGCGPTAGAGLAHVLAQVRPRLVVGLGIAGAYPGSGLGPGEVRTVSHEHFIDLGAEDGEGWIPARDLPLGLAGTHALARWPGTAPAAVVSNTCSACTGSERTARIRRERTGADLENMEGAHWAVVADFHQIPLREIRAVSNLAGPRDRGAWRIPQALDALREALRNLELEP